MPIRPHAALCLVIAGLALAHAPAAEAGRAPTPCGPRVTATHSSVGEGNWRYLYLIELVAHRAMEVRVTLQLPQTAARWPNGAAINMQPGMTTRHPFAEGVVRHYSAAEMQAHTTLMCRDLG